MPLPSGCSSKGPARFGSWERLGEGAYSLEDTLAAGAVTAAAIETGPEKGRNGWKSGNDEKPMAALALWQQWKHDP